jgi:hypothetical protein
MATILDVKKEMAESADNEPFNYEEWKASTVKPRRPRGYRDAELLGKMQKDINDKRKKAEPNSKQVSESSADAAYAAGLRQGREGFGSNPRAKEMWGDTFADYNRGFLKGRNEKAKGLKATGQGYSKKQNQVNELDTSTMQAYLDKRKETATPVTAHKAVKQAQGVRSAREKIADKEIEARARKTGRVNEDSATPSVDQVLEYLTSGFLVLKDNRNMYSEEGFATVERIYNYLRMDLLDDNFAGFSKSYSEYLAKYPDAAGELYDAMFQAAGLPDDGTYEQFMSKCMESAAKSKPVAESASAGATGAGAIATGVAGAATGKPGTGKPKKVGNLNKRTNPTIGKGIY